VCCHSKIHPFISFPYISSFFVSLYLSSSMILINHIWLRGGLRVYDTVIELKHYCQHSRYTAWQLVAVILFPLLLLLQGALCRSLFASPELHQLAETMSLLEFLWRHCNVILRRHWSCFDRQLATFESISDQS
jgi:hypothetical protein